MRERFYVIWQHVEDPQMVVISQFETSQEASTFYRQINEIPNHRRFITLIKGLAIFSNSQLLTSMNQTANNALTLI